MHIFTDFRGIKTATNLAKLLGVPASVIKKYLTPVHTGSNPKGFHLAKVDYYSVDAARAFFDSPEGKAALLEKIEKEKPAIKVLHNCAVVWTDFKPGQQPVMNQAAGVDVVVKGKFATFELPDGQKIRKPITSFGFACTNGQESIHHESAA